MELQVYKARLGLQSNFRTPEMYIWLLKVKEKDAHWLLTIVVSSSSKS